MIEFSTITAFRLVRRLAMGEGTAAMYLLIHEDDIQYSIETDLKAEIEVQLGATLPIIRVSELLDSDDSLWSYDAGPIGILRIDCWLPKMVGLFDTHVIRLERAGAQFLFLTTPELAERLLVEAPNFRNRLTEVLQIVPDEPNKAVSIEVGR